MLKLHRQHYYAWLAQPVTAAELDEAYLANGLFDAHREDPEFGYRFLADEARLAGFEACDRTMWRVYSANGWWSASGKKDRVRHVRSSPPTPQGRRVGPAQSHR